MESTPVPARDWLIGLISPTRRDLMLALRKRGEAGVTDLADDLYLSVSAVRQMLETMKGEGLILASEVRTGSGRPRKLYRLSPSAAALFDPDPLFLNLVLDAALDLAARGDALAPERWGARIAELSGATQSGGETFEDRAGNLMAYLEVLGHHPGLTQDKRQATIRLSHCPLVEAAQSRSILCELERQSMSAHLAGATVERIEWRLDGAPSCAYAIHGEHVAAEQLPRFPHASRARSMRGESI